MLAERTAEAKPVVALRAAGARQPRHVRHHARVGAVDLVPHGAVRERPHAHGAVAGAGGGEDYVEVRYEGYGPAGVAVIVDRDRVAVPVLDVGDRRALRWHAPLGNRDCKCFR